VILDGAHNPAGVRALAAYVRRFLAGRRVWLVYATMRDKAVDEITGVLVPLAHHVVLTEASSDRSLRSEALRDMIEHPCVTATANVGEALRRIRNEASPEDVVLITGSLYLVGEARAMLGYTG
jgi:dihydrofolate synthase/folylpolyglutamate synthase